MLLLVDRHPLAPLRGPSCRIILLMKVRLAEPSPWRGTCYKEMIFERIRWSDVVAWAAGNALRDSGFTKTQNGLAESGIAFKKI
jgi:hypothetical protein